MATIAVVLALAPMACANRQQDRQPSTPPPTATTPPARVARPAPPAEPSAPVAAVEPPSNTWYARRQVTVSTREDRDETRAAVQSVAGVETIRDVCAKRGVSAENNAVVVRAVPTDEEAMEVEIVVDLSKAPSQAPRVAREVADDLVRRLRQALLKEAQGEYAGQVERLEEEHQRAVAELDRSRQELAALRQKCREATGRSEADAERIRSELSQLEDRRQELQLELESRAARMNALSENMAQITKRVESEVQNDTVSAELQKVVEAREAQVERVKQMVEAGKSSRAELDEALARAAESRARLMDRRAEVAERAGRGTLNDWNQEQMRLSVDSAELQARLDKLNQRLQSFQAVAPELDHLEQLEQTLQEADQTMRETRAHLREMNRQLARMRPARSVVTDSQDKTGEPTSPQGAGDSTNPGR
jgi:DNA repair exonuclease SbcCD ATPase subunit